MDLSLSPEPKDMVDEPVAPPRNRKTAVWGEELFKSRSRKASKENFIDPDRIKGASGMRLKSVDDDIPLIPDLDDMNEDQSHEFDNAIKPTSERFASSELDSNLKKKLALSLLEGCNLSKLTKYLNSEEDIKEIDDPWTWDLLFTEVTSEMRNEEDSKSSLVSG